MGNRRLDNAVKDRSWCIVLGFVFTGLQKDLICYHMNGCIWTEILKRILGSFRSSADVAQVIGYRKIQDGVVVIFSKGRNVGTSDADATPNTRTRCMRSIQGNGNSGSSKFYIRPVRTVHRTQLLSICINSQLMLCLDIKNSI